MFMLFQSSFHHIVIAPSRGLGVGCGSELAMGGGAGGPTRLGGSRGCGERRRFLSSPCGGGCSQVPISTFFFNFLSFSVWGGWGRDLYNGLASGCKRSDRTVRTLAVL
jgi:hypothetical protein